MKGAGVFKVLGIILTVFGGIGIVGSILFAVANVAADERAAERNEKAWENYNAWVEEINSTVEDSTLAATLIELKPQPPIRQGGFASAFGIFFALCFIAIAAIPLVVGIIFLGIAKRRKRAFLISKV